MLLFHRFPIPTSFVVTGSVGSGKTFLVKEIMKSLSIPYQFVKCSSIVQTIIGESEQCLKVGWYEFFLWYRVFFSFHMKIIHQFLCLMIWKCYCLIHIRLQPWFSVDYLHYSSTRLIRLIFQIGNVWWLVLSIKRNSLNLIPLFVVQTQFNV